MSAPTILRRTESGWVLTNGADYWGWVRWWMADLARRGERPIYVEWR